MGLEMIELVPPGRWTIHWAALETCAAMRLPTFVGHRRWATDWAGIAIVVAAAFVPFVFLASISAGLASALAAAFLVSIVAAKRPKGRRTVFPSSTVGDLARAAVLLNANPAMGWTDERIWFTLQQVIAEQLHVAPSDVRKSSRFVSDLGVG